MSKEEKASDFEELDPYEALAMIEKALAFTLQIPPWLPKRPLQSTSAKDRFLGSSFTLLAKHIQNNRTRLHTLLRQADPNRGADDFSVSFTLELSGWAGTASHSVRRRELIDLLIVLRSKAIHDLGVVPEPQSLRPTAPPWKRLTKRQQEILGAIGSERVHTSEIMKRINSTSDNVRRDLGILMDCGILSLRKNVGYVIEKIPEGSPGELLAEN